LVPELEPRDGPEEEEDDEGLGPLLPDDLLPWGESVSEVQRADSLIVQDAYLGNELFSID
jgi:hypothetical protein